MKYVGAVLGFLLVRFFLLTDLEVMGFKMFLHILTDGSPFPGGSRLNAINFNSLTSDTSLKLIFGVLIGGVLGNWYQATNGMKSNKELEE
jgi:hypothetical protein